MGLLSGVIPYQGCPGLRAPPPVDGGVVLLHPGPASSPSSSSSKGFLEVGGVSGADTSPLRAGLEHERGGVTVPGGGGGAGFFLGSDWTRAIQGGTFLAGDWDRSLGLRLVLLDCTGSPFISLDVTSCAVSPLGLGTGRGPGEGVSGSGILRGVGTGLLVDPPPAPDWLE